MDNTHPLKACHTEKERFTLPRCERLARRSDIGRLFTDGEAFLVYPVKCTYMFRSGDAVDGVDEGGVVVVSDCNRVMVTAPKRNHKRAVVRNLLKRRMKEAYRLHKRLLVASHSSDISESMDGALGLDIAFSYVGKGEPEEYQRIERSVIDILNRLCKIRDQRRVF